ncbi:MAG: Rrf2 family transcriptional regulator [Schleiferiaceae bacterium]
MISKKSKYAINALVYLAKNQDQGPVSAHTIAESENIPNKFLEAILLDLKKAGILSSKKGSNGGYYLHQSPDEINMAEVMRLFDGAIAYLPCVTYKYYERCEECKDEVTCGIRDAFLDLRNKTVEMLKGNTLTDLMAREAKLKK